MAFETSWSLSGSQVGMGLGLSIAKSIAQEHGGDIAVKTERR